MQMTLISFLLTCVITSRKCCLFYSLSISPLLSHHCFVVVYTIVVGIADGPNLV